MKQKIWTIFLAVLAVVLVAAAVLIWSGAFSGNSASMPEETAAPDITVYTADGEAVKLSDFAGKPVVLNFWASWCGPCRSEMPAFEQAYGELGGQVQFLMVNLTGSSETVETASAFIADNGYTFPVFYDTAREGSMAYDVSGIPATYFIDSEGKLVTSHVGAMSAATLAKYLEMILP